MLISISIAQLFLLLGLGVFLRRVGSPSERNWQRLERATYYVLFPALLIDNVSAARFDGLPAAPMIGALIVTALVMAGLLLAIRPALGLSGPAFTSLFQGSFRFNTYIGMAVAAAFLGERGVTLAAVYIIAMVPLGNLLAVGGLALFGERSGPMTLFRVVGRIAGNPLIIACVIGLVLNRMGIQPAGTIGTALDVMGRASLMIGLVCVGSGLDFASLRQSQFVLMTASAFKLLAMPAFTFTALILFGVHGTAAVVCLLFNALPAAPSAYILSRQLGGDARLMAGILTQQTILSLITLPVLLWWFGDGAVFGK